MKVIVLLAVLCGALANEEAQMDPCLTACREQIKTKMEAEPELAKWGPERMTSPEGRAKMREFLKNQLADTPTVHENMGKPETWAKMCTLSTEAETCINACPESPKREGVKKFLGFFKLGCDEDVKSSVSCLMEVKKTPSEQCQTKCGPLGQKLRDFITQREANPDERVPAPKDVLESGCKFVNCRLNCRKNDIVNKCQDKGFESAKKMTSAFATSSKMLYKRGGGDLANWPDVCKSDKIVEPHEY